MRTPGRKQEDEGYPKKAKSFSRLRTAKSAANRPFTAPTIYEGDFQMNNNPTGFSGQVPSGTIDGRNATFTITTIPGFLFLFHNGVFLMPEVGYAISGKTITLVYVPEVGDVLYAAIFS